MKCRADFTLSCRALSSGLNFMSVSFWGLRIGPNNLLVSEKVIRSWGGQRSLAPADSSHSSIPPRGVLGPFGPKGPKNSSGGMEGSQHTAFVSLFSYSPRGSEVELNFGWQFCCFGLVCCQPAAVDPFVDLRTSAGH